MTLRTITTNVLLILISLIVAVGIAEMYLRYCTPYAGLPAVAHGYPADYFIADDTLAYDITPNAPPKIHNIDEISYPVFSNAYGCFDYPQSTIADNYALIVGDSMAWGYAPLESKWTTRLEQLSGVQMLKCGVTGYGTKQELLKAQRTIQRVGKPPAYLIVMYMFNDLNDDYLLPHRTVFSGNLVSTIKSVDLKTGHIERLSADELQSKYEKYLDTTSGWFNHMKYQLVTYRVYIQAKPRFNKWKARMKAELGLGRLASAPVGNDPKAMPDMIKGAYEANFIDYTNTWDRPWFNAAIDEHKAALMAFAVYSNSIGAKFILIDAYGTLENERFDDVRTALNQPDQGTFYYDLSRNAPTLPTWKYDAHWNVEGNQEAGAQIYGFLQRSHFFDH